MKVIRTGDFFYTKTEGKVHPKGTTMWMYAVEGTKEELDSYEEAKGANFQVFDKGTHKDKPIFSTSNRLCATGESVEVKMNATGYLNPVETTETVEAKQDLKLAKLQAEKQQIAKEQRVIALAKQAGVAISL